jgi:hypothetical protein
MDQMRYLGLAILGLIFVVSCSEEDSRIDISYTGEQLRSVKMPLGGVETGHMLINGDGSISAFNLFGTPDADGKESSMTFFSLYAAEEDGTAVIRTLGRGFLNDSAEDVKNLEAASGFEEAVFHNAFPLVQVDLIDEEVPLEVRLSAWSPFIPLDILNSNLPVAVFEWELTNPGKKPVSYSLALAMQNPPGPGGQTGRFSMDEFAITPNTASEWKGFIFSNYEGDSSIPGTGATSALSSAKNIYYVPLIGDRQKALERFWTDFSADGKLETRSVISGSSGRLESRSNKVRYSGGLPDDTDSSLDRTESRGDAVGSSGRLEKRGYSYKYSGEDSGMATLYSSGVLDPGESVTIPFLFSWFVPFGDTVEGLSASDNQKKAACQKTGIPFEDKPLDTCAEEKLSASGIDRMSSTSRSEDKPSTSRFDGTPSTSHSEDLPSASRFDRKPSTIHSEDRSSNYLSESNPTVSRFRGIDDVNGYMVSEFENLRERTMQFSHAMITSTIPPEVLEKVLSGFADAVEQRDGNTKVISNPFPGKGANGISVADLPVWDIYHANSGFTYDEEKRVMKFSPATDVLPVRFFWATQSGWGTINVSRARIVLDCISGSLDLQQLLLEGRSFFVFREFVPSQEANTTYDNETLVIKFPEKVHIPEGESFTMEIP